MRHRTPYLCCFGVSDSLHGGLFAISENQCNKPMDLSCMLGRCRWKRVREVKIYRLVIAKRKNEQPTSQRVRWKCNCYLRYIFAQGSNSLRRRSAPYSWEDFSVNTHHSASLNVWLLTFDNHRKALKFAFGEEYDKLFPGSIYSPPSYNETFSSSEGWKLSIYLLWYTLL